MSCMSGFKIKELFTQSLSNLTHSKRSKNSKRKSTSRRSEEIKQTLYIMRHGERMDLTFQGWISHCVENGKYVRRDLNMPESIPHRRLGIKGFKNDPPLTNLGMFQATLIGEALSKVNATVRFAYSSPSLRCVQTCHGVLAGLGLKKSIAIRVEPGLFEWVAVYKEGLPDWLMNDELVAAGYNIDRSYVPIISKNEMYKMMETCKLFYKRNNHIMNNILKNCPVGNILLVGHAATLEVCSRQLVGLEPRLVSDLYKIIQHIPYSSLIALEKQTIKWEFVDPPCPPITNSVNLRFNWNILCD